MENMFEQLITLPNFAFCLMVWVFVWIQRRAIKVLWKKAEKSRVYRELLLPMGPLGTGGIMAMLNTEFPYPEDFQTFWGRIFFGVMAGLGSAHAYKMAKPFLPENMQKKEPKE